MKTKQTNAVQATNDKDKELATFLQNALTRLTKASDAKVKAGEGLWAGVVTRIMDGATFDGAATWNPEIVKKGTISSIKTTITKAIKAGVALMEGDKVKGKTAVEIETKAAELGINPKNADGTKKAAKDLQAEIKAAKDEESADDAPAVVALTPAQIVAAALTYMETEPAAFLYPHRKRFNALVALMDKHAKESRANKAKGAKLPGEVIEVPEFEAETSDEVTREIRELLHAQHA